MSEGCLKVLSRAFKHVIGRHRNYWRLWSPSLCRCQRNKGGAMDFRASKSNKVFSYETFFVRSITITIFFCLFRINTFSQFRGRKTRECKEVECPKETITEKKTHASKAMDTWFLSFLPICMYRARATSGQRVCLSFVHYLSLSTTRLRSQSFLLPLFLLTHAAGGPLLEAVDCMYLCAWADGV